MTIDKIYQRYQIPPNLQQHMLNVAAVGKLCADHWLDDQNHWQDGQQAWHHAKQNNKQHAKQKTQNKNTLASQPSSRLVTTTLLLHDLGNIIKFDLSSSQANQFLHQPQKISHWRQVQQQFKQQYGSDPDKATLQIIAELRQQAQLQIPASVDYLLATHDFKVIPQLLKHWPKQLKKQGDQFRAEKQQQAKTTAHQITIYADLRVAPTGLTSITQRLQDLRQRYRHRDSRWRDKQLFQQRLQSCLQLEAKINQATTLNLTQLTSQQVARLAAQLRNYELE